FVYDGGWSSYRKRKYGSSSLDYPGHQFVVFIQNHDQIGNPCQGQRLGRFVTPAQFKLATMLLFCTPNIPLLFMGQEWNVTTPFLFFTSYEDGTLAQNIREAYARDTENSDCSAVDPQNEQQFLQSKLNWSELQQQDHAEMLTFYKEIIQLRK